MEQKKSHVCEECKDFPGMEHYCPLGGRICNSINKKACEFFAGKIKVSKRLKKTNGDLIISGGIIELKKFAYRYRFNPCSFCAFKSDDPTCKDNCLKGLAKWLNAPAEINTESEE